MRPLMLALTSLGACAANPAGSSLIGADLDEVRRHLGPPLACTAGGGTWTMSYRDESGAVVDDAITAVDEVVVAVRPDLQPNHHEGRDRWTGARIEELVAALGEGAVRARGAATVEVEFGAARFLVADGRVVGRVRE